MAIQVIREDAEPTLGGLFGQGLGQGLSSGLQALAQMKMEEMQKSRERKSIGESLKALGLQPELANLPPAALQGLITQKARATFQAPLNWQGIKTIMPELSDQEAHDVAQLSKGLQQQVYRNYTAAGLSGNNNQNVQDLTSGISIPELAQPFQQQQLSPQLNQLQPQELVQNQTQQQMQTPPQKLVSEQGKPSVVVGQSTKNLSQATGTAREPKVNKVNAPKIVQQRIKSDSASAIPRDAFPVENPVLATPEKQKTVAQRIHEAKLNTEEKKADIKKSRAYDEELDTGYNDALKQLHSSQKLTKIIRSGELPGAFTRGVVRLLSSITAAPQRVFEGTTPVSQFKSIVQELIKEDAKRYKGQGSVSDYEQRMRLSSFPDWLNDPLGNMRILDDLNNRAEEKIVMHNAKERVKEKNGGRLPSNFEKLVEQEAAPEKQKLFNKYRYGRQFVNLPLPAELSVGFTFTDPDTGIKYENNGQEFLVVDGPGFEKKSKS